MEQIAPGVHRLIFGPAQGPGMFPTNTWMIVGRDATAFVDTGWDRPEDIQARLDYIRKTPHPSLRYIAITHRHPDHMGGASAIQRAHGGVIVTHPVEKEFVDHGLEGVAVGKTASDGETVSLGDLTLEFIHAPGHTMGSMGVFIRERRALFTGDNVMGVGTSVINPGEGDIGMFMETMEKFARYDPQVIYPGHGPIVTTPVAKLRELIAHRKERENQIVAQLRAGAHTVDAILNGIPDYVELDERRKNMARNQIRSHLGKLQRERRAATPDDGQTWRVV